MWEAIFEGNSPHLVADTSVTRTRDHLNLVEEQSS